MKNILFYNDKTPETGDAIALYVAAGWGSIADYPAEQWENALNGTTRIFTAYHQEQLVGMVRVLSDNAHDTHLADFVVHPDFRRQGIGKTLLQDVATQFSHTAIYLDGLNTKSIPFFETGGFTVRTHMFVASKAPSLPAKPLAA